MRTAELIGAALDWAVAKCAWEPDRVFLYGEPVKHVRVANRPDISHEYNLSIYYTPSTDWEQGGPIIERECMDILCLAGGDDGWQADKYLHTEKVEGFGPTPLIAAMRCYVASKLGDNIDIPEELK